MKLKNFDDYLKKCIHQKDRAEIGHQVDMEYESLKAQQRDLSLTEAEYIEDKHLGSTFDSFLEEEGLYSEAETVANNRVASQTQILKTTKT